MELAPMSYLLDVGVEFFYLGSHVKVALYPCLDRLSIVLVELFQAAQPVVSCSPVHDVEHVYYRVGHWCPGKPNSERSIELMREAVVLPRCRSHVMYFIDDNDRCYFLDG